MTSTRAVETPTGRLVVHCEDGYGEIPIESISWGDDRAMAAGGVLVKRTANREVACVTVPGSGRRAFCKRYLPRGAVGYLVSLLIGSRGRREFDAAMKAFEKGLPVARPVAVAERRRCGFPVESIVATEEVPDARSVLLIWCECGANAVRRRLVRAVGKFVRSVHDRGLYHDDLAAAHILARPREGTEGGWDFTLIDLMNSSVGIVGSYARAKNLYQIMRSLSRQGMGRGGRFRMLKAYLGSGTGDRELRKWWKRIETARFLKRGNFGHSKRYRRSDRFVEGGR